MDDVFENKPLYHNYHTNPGKSLQGKTSLTKNNILRKHITNIQIFFYYSFNIIMYACYRI